jgi:ketosteroid isomerase-like protein
LKKIFWLLSLTFLISSNAIADEQSDIKNTLKKQITQLSATWNTGDLDGFLKSYKDADSTHYITSIDTQGYKNIIAQYKKRFPTSDKMGKLTVSNLEVNVLSSQYAMVVGKWKVTQNNKSTSGFFSLIYENTSEGWKIILDHTS